VNLRSLASHLNANIALRAPAVLVAVDLELKKSLGVTKYGFLYFLLFVVSCILVLSPDGMTLSLCASLIMPMPMCGRSTKRINMIPTILFNPNPELPGPIDKVPSNTNMSHGTNIVPSIVRL